MRVIHRLQIAPIFCMCAASDETTCPVQVTADFPVVRATVSRLKIELSSGAFPLNGKTKKRNRHRPSGKIS